MNAPLVCSARACRDPATWALLWNNPRIHSRERRKVWLACPEHREHLSDVLRVRGFLDRVVPVGEIPPDAG